MGYFTNKTAVDAESGRRRFLRWLLALPVIAPALAFLGAGLAYLWPPRQPRGGGLVDLGAEADVPEGKGVVRSLESGPVLVIKEDGQCRALSAACTHLGCPVRWRGETGDIFCSCHGGVFDKAGNPIRGPVRSPLKPVPLRVVAGRLLIEVG